MGDGGRFKMELEASSLQPGTFGLLWITRILIDLHDVLPLLPLSSADTMSTLPHCLKLVWLMKDLCPKPVEGTHSLGKVSLTMLGTSMALVLPF